LSGKSFMGPDFRASIKSSATAKVVLAIEFII
jgi:hypothetical protein